MENKRAVIIAAIIALVVAALIVGAIIFLTSLLRGRTSGPTVVTSSPVPTASAPANNSPAGQLAPTAPSNTKIIGIGGYSMSYPNNWGVLKCSNSQNLEFDPYNGTDQMNVICDYAVKPITILATTNLSCPGETVTLGTNQVIRSKTSTTTGVDYRWCVIGSGTHLDITHRVSNDGSRATSKDDFSAQIEQIITSIRTGGAS